MSKYKTSKITTNGQELLMQCLANKAEMQFTRIAFGNGVYSSDYGLAAQTALKSEKQSVSLSSITVKSKNSLVISSVLSNEALTEGYRLNEIGLFAKNKADSNATEILYAICIAEDGYADYFPAYNGYAPTRILQDFYVEVADASNTTILVDDNVSVSKGFLEANYYTAEKTNDLLSKKFDFKGQVDATDSAQGNNLSSLFDNEIETGTKIIYYDGKSYALLTFRGCYNYVINPLTQICITFDPHSQEAVMRIRTGKVTTQNGTDSVSWNAWKNLAFEAGES